MDLKKNVGSLGLKLWLCTLFFALSLMLNAISLEAAGWGKKKQVSEFEGAKWNLAFCDINDLYFKAFIPNYIGASLNNGDVYLCGKIDESGYIIITSSGGKLKMKSLQQFIKIIQDGNADHDVRGVDTQKFGYAVDLIPRAKGGNYWRFININKRLVKMGTADANEARRLYFFESFRIK